MKKKLTASLLCLSLLLIMLLGSTLAWFTDDVSTTNTMTVGNVKIEQYEKDRLGNNFKQNQNLFPAVIMPDQSGKLPKDENGLWLDANINNELDKIVTVQNTGVSDAYIRTVFAFETRPIYVENSTAIYGYLNWEYIGVNGAMEFLWVDEAKTPLTFTRNGVEYALAVYYYKGVEGDGIITKDEITEPSMRQFFLSPHANNEFFTLVDGTYEILVLSQAVQTQGFESAQQALDMAFGEVNSANAITWFANVNANQ